MTSAFHVYFGPEAFAAAPRVKRLHPDDCISALKEGVDDFFAMPTYPIFVGLFYAVAGIALFAMTSFGDALHLAFPLAAGFALIGPFVAIGLYEMSRRRERGLAVRGRDAFTVLRSPALPSILAFGLILLAIFAAWMFAAELIYVWLYGPNPPAAVGAFLHDVLTTGRGSHADRRRRAGWLLFRRAHPRDQRRLIPADARPRPRPCAGARDFLAGHAGQSARRCALGPDRRRGAHPWLAAAVLRPRRRHAGPWPRDLAPLSKGDRARPCP